MNGFSAFLSKELLQALRSMRFLIVVAAFLILGLMNAPLAKFTPQILELAGVGEMLEGLIPPTPVAFDAWAQFFSNIAQMGILAILLLCGPMLSWEKSKGTLVLPLTKGLGRMSVVLIKFIVMTLLWTLGLLVASLVSWGCTLVLFPGETVEYLALGIFLLWLLGVFLLALVPLSSVLFRGSMSGLILPGAVLFIFLIALAFPNLISWNPLLLGQNSVLLLIGAAETGDFLAPSLVAGITAIVTLVAALISFRKAAL